MELIKEEVATDDGSENEAEIEENKENNGDMRDAGKASDEKATPSEDAKSVAPDASKPTQEEKKEAPSSEETQLDAAKANDVNTNAGKAEEAATVSKPEEKNDVGEAKTDADQAEGAVAEATTREAEASAEGGGDVAGEAVQAARKKAPRSKIVGARARFRDSEGPAVAVGKLKEIEGIPVTCRVLEGEEERLFWERLWEAADSRDSSKGKGKGKGKDGKKGKKGGKGKDKGKNKSKGKGKDKR